MRLSSLRTVSAWNIILWLVADGAQMWRTIFEERMLRADAHTWRISSESAGA